MSSFTDRINDVIVVVKLCTDAPVVSREDGCVLSVSLTVKLFRVS